MSPVEKIKAEIEALSQDEYLRLRRWFSDRDWQKWDRKIQLDSEKGKLDFLVREARDENAKGTLRDL